MTILLDIEINKIWILLFCFKNGFKNGGYDSFGSTGTIGSIDQPESSKAAESLDPNGVPVQPVGSGDPLGSVENPGNTEPVGSVQPVGSVEPVEAFPPFKYSEPILTEDSYGAFKPIESVEPVGSDPSSVGSFEPVVLGVGSVEPVPTPTRIYNNFRLR